MSSVSVWLLSFGLSLSASDKPTPIEPARLKQILEDRQQLRQQSQAALLLVQSASPEAEAIVRQGLKQSEAVETFVALANALKLQPDARFLDELVEALRSARPVIRQAASEALAPLAHDAMLAKVLQIADDPRAELACRQAALQTLGRSGRHSACAFLLGRLNLENETLKQTSLEALAELTGLEFGPDSARWRAWWEQAKQLSETDWLTERHRLQTSKARRLDAELERAKAQIVRLQQQLYSRLPAADRLAHVQALSEHEDAALRQLAVSWCSELYTASDALSQRALAEALLKLSQDSSVEIQRAATLGLARVHDAKVFERLQTLLVQSPTPVRAAAARALGQQAKGTDAEAYARKKQVIPLLQKAVADGSVTVVVEAAEALGLLGVPEANPILVCLLPHESESVRLTVAQALERVADAQVLDALVGALADPSVQVRFSLVGALGQAMLDKKGVTEAQKAQLVTRLETLVQRDADPGVRSRTASILGEIAPPSSLPILWQRVLASEDSRVQEKAWSAFLEILARSNSLELLRHWQKELSEGKHEARLGNMVQEMVTRWSKREESRPLALLLADDAIALHLSQGKWMPASALLHELLLKTTNEADLERRLRALLLAADQAGKEGNLAEKQRLVLEAKTYLPRCPKLAEEIQKLQ